MDKTSPVNDSKGKETMEIGENEHKTIEKPTEGRAHRSLRKSTLPVATIPEVTNPKSAKKTRKEPEPVTPVDVKAENGQNDNETSPSSGTRKSQRSPRSKRKTGDEKSSEEHSSTTPVNDARPSSKRRKMQTTLFQSPPPAKNEAELKTEAPNASATPAEKVFMFKKGKFLAVRNSEGGFYLCQTAQNVFRNGRPFKVRWLDETVDANVYELDFYDNIEMETVLTVLNMQLVSRNKYKIPEREKDRATAILKRALDAERRGVKPEEMQPIDPNDDDEDEDVDDEDEEMEEEEEEEEVEEEAPKPTKRGRTVTPRSTSRVSSRRSPQRSTSRGRNQAATPRSNPRAPRAARGRAEKPTPSPAEPPAATPPRRPRAKQTAKSPTKPEAKAKVATPTRGKRHPNDKLVANPDIKVLEKDTFFETSEDCPSVSSSVSSKLVIRAVILQDNRLLQRYVDDLEHVALVDYPRSVMEPNVALQYAIEKENHRAVEILMKVMYGAKQEDEPKRVGLPNSLLDVVGTGIYNPRSLNVRVIRKLTMSRGSREGTNALTKDIKWRSSNYDTKGCLKTAMEAGVKLTTLQKIVDNSNKQTNLSSAFEYIYLAVRAGHRRLAGQLVEECFKQQSSYGYGFNQLHKEVLLNDKQELAPIKMPSVKKKPMDNAGITPIHCAAINPNAAYLIKLLSVLPDYNIMDKHHWRPIHYAAACEGTAPLEYLLSRGMSTEEVDTSGLTPLMIAVMTARPHNVEMLLKKASEEQEHKQHDTMTSRWGLGGINRANKAGSCPIHIAAKKGYLDVCRVLVKYGADLRKQQSAAREKLSALQEASAHGHLAVVRFLVKSGAVVEQLDRFKRTALMLACMNGQAHVTSYLLSLGSNPNHCDSSGNSCLHYAVAYGWYHSMQALLQAGADPTKSNDWKVSLLHIAFMKGHTGLMDVLLQKPGVDINFRDDVGATLVMLATSNALAEGFSEQMSYLVERHEADCTLSDSEGNSALHHLAGNVPKNEEGVVLVQKTAELLKQKGCDVHAKNKEGLTPTMVALRSANTVMVEYLISHGARVTLDCDGSGKNALHWMAAESLTADMAALLQLLSKQSCDLEAMSRVADDEGFTPLLTACHVYSSFNEEGKEAAVKLKRGLAFIKVLLKEAKPNLTTTVDIRRVKKELRESLSDELEQSTDDDEDSEMEEEEKQNGVDHVDDDVITDRPNVKMNGKKNDPYGPYGKYSAVHFLVLDENHLIDDTKGQDYEALRTLLQYKPPLNLVDKNGLSPLLLAIKYGQVECAEILVEAGADVNTSSEDYESDGKCSALIFAARGDHTFTKLVGALIQHGADVTSYDQRNHNTALHYAAEQRVPADLLGTVRLLVEGKADVNAMNNRKRTPLHLAVNCNSGLTDESTDMEQYLLENGANVFAKDVRGRLPIHYAFVKIRHHRVTTSLDPIELVSTLTNAMKSVDVNHSDEFGQTTLHRAALRGATVCCMHLLQKGASIDVKDKLGNTPLSLAVTSGHDSCAIALIQKNGNINVNCVFPPNEATDETKPATKEKEKPEWVWKAARQEEKHGNTEYPLFQAILDKDWQGVTYMYLDLLDKFGVKYAQCIEGAFAVHKFQLALRLVTRQSDVTKLTTLNANQQTLFHVLCQLDGSQEPGMQMKVAEALHSRGVALNNQDVYGCTPLHYAALSMNLPLMNFILEKCSGPFLVEDKFGRTPLAAVFWDLSKTSMVDEKVCKMLLKEGSLDFLVDYPSGDPGHYSGRNQCKRYNYTSKPGSESSTPLIHAVSVCNLDLVKLLLQLGANVNMADSQRRTPLMHAVRQNDVNMVKLLLDHTYELEKSVNRPRITREDSIKDTAKLRVFQLRKMQSFITSNGYTEDETASKNLDDDNDTDVEDESCAQKKLPLTKKNTIDMTFETATFTKRSAVDVSAVDAQHWTVLHHLAAPIDIGTFDNLTLLKILVDNGADLLAKTGAGLTPLDLALKNGGEKLARGIQRLLKLAEPDWVSPVYERFVVDDGIDWPSPAPDSQADAAMLQRAQDEKHMDTDTKTQYLPDEKSGLRQTGELFMDEELQVPYDVFLSKVDVNAGPWGMYNFYRMQLIREKGKDLYVLFTRWGRMGDDGQHQKTPFPNLDDGLKEFHKIFKEKTANEWKNMKSFEKRPKKYYLNEREDRRIRYRDVAISLKSSLATKLPPMVQDFFKELTDVSTLEVVLSDSGIDKDYLPVGGLNRQAILKAKDVLNEISSTFEKTYEHEVGTEKLSQEDYQAACEKIATLSNEFYQLVPRKNFIYERIEPLNQQYIILAHRQMLANLLDWEIASKILIGAQYRISEINPLDYVYRATGCKIHVLKQDDIMTQYILQNIHNTKQGSGRVEAIYSVSRPGEDDRLSQTGLGNRRLLWHGTGSSNLLGILSRGLVKKPLESNHSGAMFGEGLYFADSFCKSSGYSYNCSGKETKFILMLEVALGKVKEYYESHDVVLDNDYNSVKGLGRRCPDPDYDIHLPSGAVISLGAMINAPKPHSDFHYNLEMNEYIIYNENQACMRYIVQFK